MPLQKSETHLQTSALNTCPPISALIIQWCVLPIHPSAVRDDPPAPPLYIFIKGPGVPPNPTSDVRYHAPLLSAFHPQRVEPPLQPSAVKPSYLPHILGFPLQQEVFLNDKCGQGHPVLMYINNKMECSGFDKKGKMIKIEI